MKTVLENNLEIEKVVFLETLFKRIFEMCERN